LDAPGAVLNVISGWLIIYASGNRREILDLALPGDMLGGFPPDADPSTAIASTLTETVLCPIPWAALAKIRLRRSALDARLLEMHAETLARSREHLRRLGWRSARERVASLLLELALRAQPGRQILSGATVFMPLTQQHVADAAGLTAIHVNRTLRDLRDEGVCRLNRGTLWIGRIEEMAALAGLGIGSLARGGATIGA
jgi:CRP-like cAMP-binding protein